MENIKSIGNEIRKARLNKNLTMDTVAMEVGITRSTLFTIEKGQSNYSLNTLLKLINYLDLSISFNETSKKAYRNRATRVNSKLDKKINRFVIMCVEMYAEYKNKSDHETYKLLKRNNVLKELTDDYDDLHSMGSEWLNDYIDSLVRV